MRGAARCRAAVEPPAEEGHDSGGDRQLERRRQCVTGAPAQLTLGGEIDHPVLPPSGHSADLAMDPCEFFRNLQDAVYPQANQHPQGTAQQISNTASLQVPNPGTITIPPDDTAGAGCGGATGGGSADALDARGAPGRGRLPTWFHTIDLGGGVVTPGQKDTLTEVGIMRLPADLTGRTVLDIGAYDGFYSFEAERRGASRVVATDHWAWTWPGRDARRTSSSPTPVLDSKVEDVVVTVEDLSARGGRRHLRRRALPGRALPLARSLGYLRRLRTVTAGVAIVETVVDLLDVPCPPRLLPRPLAERRRQQPLRPQPRGGRGLLRRRRLRPRRRLRAVDHQQGVGGAGRAATGSGPARSPGAAQAAPARPAAGGWSSTPARARRRRGAPPTRGEQREQQQAECRHGPAASGPGRCPCRRAPAPWPSSAVHVHRMTTARRCPWPSRMSRWCRWFLSAMVRPARPLGPPAAAPTRCRRWARPG